MSARIVGKGEMVVRDGSTEHPRREECHVLGRRRIIGFVGSIGSRSIGSQGNGKRREMVLYGLRVGE
jgi:hypothetical protein